MAQLFDGALDSQWKPHFSSSGGAVGTRKWTFSDAISCSKVRLYCQIDNLDQSDINVYVNDVKQSFPNSTTGWFTPTGVTYPLTSVATTIKSHGGGWAWVKIFAIEVDGHVLVDSIVDNSFQLKFNDTSSNAALGYDSLSTKTIRKQGSTTDFNTDADADELVLAIPGDTIEDVHATVKGSGSAKSLTNTNCTTSTTTSVSYTHLTLPTKA